MSPQIKPEIHHVDATVNTQPGLNGFKNILVIGVFAELFDHFIHVGFGTLDNALQTALEQLTLSFG